MKSRSSSVWGVVLVVQRGKNRPVLPRFGALKAFSLRLSRVFIQSLPRRSVTSVSKTTVFGTFGDASRNPGVYAWDSVPKDVPKSKAQNLAYSGSFGTLVT